MAEKKIKIPQYEIEALARCFLPDILAFYESEKGQKESDELEEAKQKGSIISIGVTNQ